MKENEIVLYDEFSYSAMRKEILDSDGLMEVFDSAGVSHILHGISYLKLPTEPEFMKEEAVFLPDGTMYTGAMGICSHTCDE